MVTLPTPFTDPDATSGTVLFDVTELKLARVSLASLAALSSASCELAMMVTARRFCEVAAGVNSQAGGDRVVSIRHSSARTREAALKPAVPPAVVILPADGTSES